MCNRYYSTSVCWQDFTEDVFVKKIKIKTINNDFKRKPSHDAQILTS